MREFSFVDVESTTDNPLLIFLSRHPLNSFLCFVTQYDNNVQFEGVRFICSLHRVIIGQSEARADLMARKGLQMNLIPEK